MVSSFPATHLKRQRQRVIVLGAGISGLACAKELQQRGYQVLVIEARQRIGGRLKGGAIETLSEHNNNDATGEKGQAVTGSTNTLQLSTSSPVNQIATSPSSPFPTPQQQLHVDLGGALIHGILENPVYSLVQQMGIPVQALSDTLLLDAHGWPVDAARDDKVSTLFNDCLEESFRRISLALEARNSRKTATTRTRRRLRRTAQQEEALPPPPPTNFEAAAAALPDNDDDVDDGDKKQSATIITPEASATSNKDEEDDEDVDDDNYGHLFQCVCRQKNVSTENNALWKWHQANLEVSCGASFDQLGYTWNEDEAYGFDGDHVALSTSWKTVMEGLADGLEILMASPVTRVCRVDANAWQEQRKAAARTALLSSSQCRRTESETLSPLKSPPHHPSTPSAIARRSRRLLGEDANVRRSSRATKGQLVESRLTVSNVAVWSYDDDTGHQQRSTPDTKRRRLNDDDDNDGRPDSSTHVQVTLKDGTVLEADAVVCTLPLAILKIPTGKPGHVEFYPPLTKAKQEAIQKLGCGILNKCALSFPRIFWQDVDFLGLASEPRRPYLIMNAAKYTTDHKPVLIFMYGGAFAKEIEDWKDSDIVEDCMSVLRALYGQRDVVPEPLDYLVTRWGHEQFSRMAFTYVPPGVDGMHELERMSEPIYDTKMKHRPVVMFAGEHTTPFHPSTIHGAFLSGIREAYRLDLAMEPEANGNLEFSDEQLYQRTFTVRRKVRGATMTNGAASSQATTHNTGSHIGAQKVRHRRRCIAGAMALRRNPKTILKEETPLANGAVVASRRSQRSLSKRPIKGEESADMDSPGPSDRLSKFSSPKSSFAPYVDLHALEDRTLLRSVESYGRDFAFVRAKVLPVHGSSRRKNPSQLRTRYQTLTRSAPLDTKSDNLKAAWEASAKFEPPALLQERSAEPGEPTPDEKRRKSGRNRTLGSC